MRKLIAATIVGLAGLVVAQPVGAVTPTPTRVLGGIQHIATGYQQRQALGGGTRTFSFGAIRGRLVRRRDRDVGVLKDLRLASDRSVAAVVVEYDGREIEFPFDVSITFDPRSRSAA